MRAYRPADAEELAEVYRDAVRSLGPTAYGERQVRAWARHPDDLEAFRAALAEGVTLIIVRDDRPVAFGQLHPVDHVAYLYCAPAHARRGYAVALLSRLEALARAAGVAVLRVEASLVARGFFERMGFVVTSEERVVRHGVAVPRARMRKRLQEPGGPSAR